VVARALDPPAIRDHPFSLDAGPRRAKSSLEPHAAGAHVLDPKVLLMLATGTLLLLNGLIARAAAAKRPANDASEAADEAADPGGDGATQTRV
jgi:hypothetical protein